MVRVKIFQPLNNLRTIVRKWIQATDRRTCAQIALTSSSEHALSATLTMSCTEPPSQNSIAIWRTVEVITSKLWSYTHQKCLPFLVAPTKSNNSVWIQPSQDVHLLFNCRIFFPLRFNHLHCEYFSCFLFYAFANDTIGSVIRSELTPETLLQIQQRTWNAAPCCVSLIPGKAFTFTPSMLIHTLSVWRGARIRTTIVNLFCASWASPPLSANTCCCLGRKD